MFLMVTIITASGSPIQISQAEDAQVQNGTLVCLDAGGRRVIAFDLMDVHAYAVESHKLEPVWVAGGQALLTATAEAAHGTTLWRWPGRPRFSYK